jgi:hypothetical protein
MRNWVTPPPLGAGWAAEKPWAGLLARVFAVWIGLHGAGVLAAWLWARIPPIADMRLRMIDLSAGAPGAQTLLIAANRPHPARGDLIGHLWVIWPAQGARPARAFGYYADSQPLAAATLALSMISPTGFLAGSAPVPGGVRSDDGQSFDAALAVRVSPQALDRALSVHARWAARRDYLNRPAAFSAGAACQDYVMAVAGALGLSVPTRNWMEFPATSFRALDRANPAQEPP